MQLFRTLCRIGINTVIILKEYPSKEANRITSIVRENELNECVQLKYVDNIEGIKNIDDTIINEIIEKLYLKQTDTKETFIDKGNDWFKIKEKDHNYNKTGDQQYRTNKYAIIFGRRERYFIRKELYNDLKRGISLKEIREKYGDNIYNIIIKMHDDGVIIMNGDKVMLVD